MADAAPNYWCHVCKQRVRANGLPEAPACARCGSDFIEEVDPTAVDTFFGGAGGAGGGLLDEFDGEADEDAEGAYDEDEDADGEDGHDNLAADPRVFTDLNTIMHLLMNGRNPQAGQPQPQAGQPQPQAGQPPLSGQPFVLPFAGSNIVIQTTPGVGPGGLPGMAGGGGAVPPAMGLLMQQLFGPDMFGGRNAFQMVGNPGDYVMGQRGLDDVITRLMEQDGLRNAPPPAPADVIASLPKLVISDQDVADKAECAICRDEFKTGDAARELPPCHHRFHEGCVVPWLQLHGTCPVCRVSLVTPPPAEGKKGSHH